MMGIQGLYKTEKSWGGFHHLLLVYDAFQLSTVYVVKKQVNVPSLIANASRKQTLIRGKENSAQDQFAYKISL